MDDPKPRVQAPDTSPSFIQCGIVMPISAIGECNEGHWTEVFGIITEALEPVGFKARMVSGADEVTIIQKTIIQNLYDDPVVLVDVSERNPNVMFELGIRLAFDKPTIIIKDDRTPFIFDTEIIEHLEYPRDLRFSRIVEFKRRLAEKVLATHQKRMADSSYSTFLRHFGEFKVASIDHKEVSGQDYIIAKLGELEKTVFSITAPFAPSRRPIAYPAGNEVDICCGPLDESDIERLRVTMTKDEKIRSVRIVSVGDHLHLYAASDVDSVSDRRELEERFRRIARTIKSSPRARPIRLPIGTEEDRSDRH
jgi:hypothetical protein